MENKEFNQWKKWHQNKRFKEDKGVVGIAYKTIVEPMYTNEAVRRDPPTQKTKNYYNDLKNKHGFGKYLPEGFNPHTQKEYGLGVSIMADKQYKATNGRYGKLRRKNKNEK